MSYYRLYINGEKTDHSTQASRPTRGLINLCQQAGLDLVGIPSGRYGHAHNADGETVNVSALTEPWSRRRIDPQERTTRL